MQMFKKKRKNKRVNLDIAAGVSGNPSSPHAEGRAARAMLETARTRIARLVEAKSDDVIFTSSATEANALTILGRVRAARTEGLTRPHALYLPSAHASIVENMKLMAEGGADIEALPIKNCQVDCDALVKILRPETVLVSMDAVCGETGVIWNTRGVANVLAKARQERQSFAPSGPARTGSASRRNSAFPAGPYLHVDASQAPLTEKMTRAHFGADIITLDASKVCATRGVGCLIASRSILLTPLYRGGGQERGLRPGSEAPELAAAFAEGLSRAEADRERFRAEASSARAELIKVIRAGIPTILINEASDQAPHILNLSLLGRDTDYLVALLDEAGIAVSTRSACETDSRTGSRAVFALYGDAERAASTVRVSWGPERGPTLGRALARFAQALIKACTFIDSAGAP